MVMGVTGRESTQGRVHNTQGLQPGQLQDCATKILSASREQLETFSLADNSK